MPDDGWNDEEPRIVANDRRLRWKQIVIVTWRELNPLTQAVLGGFGTWLVSHALRKLFGPG